VKCVLRRLSELRPGEEGVVTRIVGKGVAVRRIADMGLIPGTKVRVLRKAPLGDPIEFEIRGYNLSLRKDEANLILVEVTRSESPQFSLQQDHTSNASP